ncbi:hypothetical protein FQN54_006508 [Arachnomyces sp. PD_36]|nr:hypothetical protein FQN54_006508 [Arachnomyces sp. PD_36]
MGSTDNLYGDLNIFEHYSAVAAEENRTGQFETFPDTEYWQNPMGAFSSISATMALANSASDWPRNGTVDGTYNGESITAPLEPKAMPYTQNLHI